MNKIVRFDKNFSFLSNFYFSPMTINDKVYNTNEHWFQSQKFQSNFIQEIIRSAGTPGIAKKLGRKYKIRPDWEQIKEDIMYRGLQEKFLNKELRLKLIDTFPLWLEEGNYWHDNYWGVCNCPRCFEIESKNRLGILLMKRRKELKCRK